MKWEFVSAEVVKSEDIDAEEVFEMLERYMNEFEKMKEVVA